MRSKEAMDLGGSRRRGSGPKAGSVWESRIRIDEVKGGIKVFNATHEIPHQNTPQIPEIQMAPKQSPTGKRKTWKSEGLDGSPVKIAGLRSELSKNFDESSKELSVPSDGIKKSPVSVEKTRSGLATTGVERESLDGKIKKSCDDKKVVDESRSNEEDCGGFDVCEEEITSNVVQIKNPSLDGEDELDLDDDDDEKIEVENKSFDVKQISVEDHKPKKIINHARFHPTPTKINSCSGNFNGSPRTNSKLQSFADLVKVNRRLLYNNKDVSVAPYGEYWRQLKSICVLQLLSNKRVQSFHSIREEETGLLMKKIAENNPGSVNLSLMFTELMNNVVCRAAFGRTYSEGENGKKFLSLLQEFLELLGTISIGNFVPCLSWIDRVNGFDTRVDVVAKELDEFLEKVIQERLENPTLHAAKKESGENFIDILLDVYQDNSIGVPIERDSIKAIILDVFGAGTDTTSTVLEWAMTELLRHPLILEKLQDEVREIVKERDYITNDDLEKMHYLKAVIKETLRCHTPIPLLVPRIARKDVKVMGYDVSAGTMVMINAGAIARDPISWDEPEKFNPDRFLNSSVDYKGLDFELIPFGAGRRGCPGIAFAITINEYVLANLVRKFDWKLPDEVQDLDMSEKPGIAIRRAVPLLAVGTQCHSS